MIIFAANNAKFAKVIVEVIAGYVQQLSRSFACFAAKKVSGTHE